MKNKIINFWKVIKPSKHDAKLSFIMQELITDNSTLESIILLREVEKRLTIEIEKRKEICKNEILIAEDFFQGSRRLIAQQIKEKYNYQFQN